MGNLKIQMEVGGRIFQVVQPGMSVAIPLHFNGVQPNTYGVEIAKSQAYESGGWVGDTMRGGSCNFETYNFTPHCNGTHTECVGHISDERVRIHERLQESLLPATLITVQPVRGNSTLDSYDPILNVEDLVIDRKMLVDALSQSDATFHEALLIRTLPNNPNKMARDYMKNAPAFFTLEAMQYLVGLGVVHLLVDTPSVDRLFDEGKLSAHHIFWRLEAGSHRFVPNRIPPETITEMIYVEGSIRDGNYLLNLQIAPFMADASPSRPILYALIPE